MAVERVCCVLFFFANLLDSYSLIHDSKNQLQRSAGQLEVRERQSLLVMCKNCRTFCLVMFLFSVLTCQYIFLSGLNTLKFYSVF